MTTLHEASVDHVIARSRFTAAHHKDIRDMAISGNRRASMATTTMVVVAFCLGLQVATVLATYVEHVDVAVVPAHTFEAPFSSGDWAVSGSAAKTEQYVRITPTVASSTGAMWSNSPVNYGSWEVAIDFRVSGERFIGGDGFAFWYTEDKGVTGNTFGNEDSFKGLAVIFDTYDNDGKRDNPSISAYQSNTGLLRYDHETDGEKTMLDGAFCRVSYRNTRKPGKIRINYSSVDHTLSLYYDVKGNNHYQQCFMLKDVTLPQGYYFGITAHTGDVADNHDVYRFASKNLEDTHKEAAHAEGGSAGSEEEEEGDDDEPVDAGEDKDAPTDNDLLSPLAKAVEKWGKVPEMLKPALVQSRKDYMNQQAAAEDDHDHDHGSGDNTEFETKVLNYLEGLSNSVHDLFGEVEEVGKAIAEVNFDLNTNVIPTLDGKAGAAGDAKGDAAAAAAAKAAAAAASAPPPSPAPAPPASAPTDGSYDYDRTERAIKATSDDTVKQVTALLEEHGNKVKALQSDISEVKGIVTSRLGDNRQDQEMASKMSLLSNEVIKLKTLVQDIHASKDGASESVKEHLSSLKGTLNDTTVGGGISIFTFCLLQAVVLMGFILYKKHSDSKKMHLL